QIRILDQNIIPDCFGDPALYGFPFSLVGNLRKDANMSGAVPFRKSPRQGFGIVTRSIVDYDDVLLEPQCFHGNLDNPGKESFDKRPFVVCGNYDGQDRHRRLTSQPESQQSKQGAQTVDGIDFLSCRTRARPILNRNLKHILAPAGQLRDDLCFQVQALGFELERAKQTCVVSLHAAQDVADVAVEEKQGYDAQQHASIFAGEVKLPVISVDML